MASIIEPSAKKPALWMFNSTVVIPKPIKPSGAGFANIFFSAILDHGVAE